MSVKHNKIQRLVKRIRPSLPKEINLGMDIPVTTPDKEPPAVIIPNKRLPCLLLNTFVANCQNYIPISAVTTSTHKYKMGTNRPLLKNIKRIVPNAKQPCSIIFCLRRLFPFSIF